MGSRVVKEFMRNSDFLMTKPLTTYEEAYLTNFTHKAFYDINIFFVIQVLTVSVVASFASLHFGECRFGENSLVLVQHHFMRANFRPTGFKT